MAVAAAVGDAVTASALIRFCAAVDAHRRPTAATVLVYLPLAGEVAALLSSGTVSLVPVAGEAAGWLRMPPTLGGADGGRGIPSPPMPTALPGSVERVTLDATSASRLLLVKA